MANLRPCGVVFGAQASIWFSMAVVLTNGAILHAEADKSEPLKVTFKTLATYPVEATEGPVPARFAELNGSAVVLTGYMLPVGYAKGRTREFMLMRSQATCCFGVPPKANEFVFVSTAAPEGVLAKQDVPATFTGTFHVRPIKVGESMVQCFEIENAKPL